MGQEWLWRLGVRLPPAQPHALRPRRYRPATISVQAANRKDAEVFDDELIHHLPKATLVLLGDGGYDQESCYSNCDEREVTRSHIKKTPHPNVVNL